MIRKLISRSGNSGRLVPCLLWGHHKPSWMLSNSRSINVKSQSDQVRLAYQIEADEIGSLSTLINQSSAKGLSELRDVEPLMHLFKTMQENGSVTLSMSRDVTAALARSAKDATTFFRTMTSNEKSAATSHLFARLLKHADVVAEALVSGQIPRDIRTAGTLLSAYEVMKPSRGVEFFRALGMQEVAGSVIPCMVKANKALEEIELVYRNSPRKHPRLVANMTWAYLIRGNVEEARALRAQIYDAPPSVDEFLMNAFVGDGTAEIGTEELARTEIAPRPAAMVRLLHKAWVSTQDTETQLAMFEKYLELSRGASEAQIKPVTYQVVLNILTTGSDGLPNEDALTNLQKVSAMYRHHFGHSVFLNIVLTHISKKWPTQQNLILDVLREYGPEDASPASFRVRLNALARLQLEGKDDLVRSFWRARQLLPEPLFVYDWLALIKATGASEIFYETWDAEGRPFYDDLAGLLRTR